MKSIERMYIAISGGVPDRVPTLPKIWLDLACEITGTSLMGIISDPAALLDVMARAAIEVGADGFRQFHVPARNFVERNDKLYEVDRRGVVIGSVDVYGGLITHLNKAEDFNYEDPWFMAHNHFWMSDAPLIPDMDAASKICVPDKTFYKEIGCADNQLSVLKKYGDEYAVVGDCASGTMAFLITMRGMQQALIDLLTEPQLVHKIMEKGAAYAIEKGKFNIDLGIRILRLNDSAGNMLLISPELWEEYVYPHLKTICSALHNYCPEVRIYCHMCGNIMPVLEKLADSGLDCIGPLDPLGGVRVEEVRRIVGNDIALMGGVNTMSFLKENPREVLDEAKQCIGYCGARGGYVLSSGCMVPRNSKVANIRALEDAARQYGRYVQGQLESAR